MALTETDIDRIRARHMLAVGDQVEHTETGLAGTVTRVIMRNGLAWRVHATIAGRAVSGYASGFESLETGKAGGNG